MKKIIFIGAGNLATNLAIAIKQKDYSITQVYSRTLKSASELASQVNSVPITSIAEINTEADYYIFSVKDAVLEQLISEMPSTKGIWIHTAGSIPANIFSKYTENYGVFYPLQTFSKQRQLELANIPIFIEASSSNILHAIKELSLTLSQKVTEIDSVKRQYLHLTAVFACNFTNHLYSISKEILDKENIEFSSLIPLIEETTAKIKYMSPKGAQTGPAVRFDENIMNKHLSLIESPIQKEIYELMSKAIYDSYK